jgi:hypothetical protein
MYVYATNSVNTLTISSRSVDARSLHLLFATSPLTTLAEIFEFLLVHKSLLTMTIQVRRGICMIEQQLNRIGPSAHAGVRNETYFVVFQL